jgi:hypothetical protein
MMHLTGVDHGCRLGFVVAASFLAISASSCSRDAANEDIRTQVQAAIDGYLSVKHDGPVLAKATFRQLGDEAVPYLRTVLRSRKGNHLGALAALRDIGSGASFAVLVEALDGRTRASRREAAVFVNEFRRLHGWSTDRTRTIPDLTRAALDFVKTASSFQKRYACRFAVDLSLNESAPILRKYARDSDYETRLAARDALYALTGEHINIDRPVERLIDVKLDPSLMSCQSTVMTDGITVLQAHLGTGRSGSPLLVVATVQGSNTTVAEYDVAFQKTGGFSVPLVFDRFLVSPTPPIEDQPWLVAMAAPNSDAHPYLAVAFDRSGNEIWRYESPGGNLLTTAAWVYGDDGSLSSVVVGWPAGAGCVGLSFSGNEQWRAIDQSFGLLRSNECVDNRLLKGAGSVSLLDNACTSVAKTPRGRNFARIRDAAIIPLGSGNFAVAASRRGPKSQPQLALYDEGLTEIWCSYPGEPVVRVAALSNSCERESLILAVTGNGDLMAFDAAGVLRWRGQTFKSHASGTMVRAIESWSSPTEDAAWVLVSTDDTVSLCTTGEYLNKGATLKPVVPPENPIRGELQNRHP